MGLGVHFGKAEEVRNLTALYSRNAVILEYRNLQNPCFFGWGILQLQ
jgi:hypothetical protein